MSENIDLSSIFQTVTKELMKNQQSLNQADGYNQDHGDNMVRTFRTITKSITMKKKQGSSDSAALAYAAKRLNKSGTGASAKLYAEGLTRAATQFQGKQIDQRSGLQLLQTLIGGGQEAPQNTQPAQGGDLMSSLLGGMLGGAEQPAQQTSTEPGGGLLGSLLGGMLGGSEQPAQQSSAEPGGGLLGGLLGGMLGEAEHPAQQSTAEQSNGLLGSLLGGLAGGSGSGSGLQDGFDLGDLLSVGMAFMQQKQQGKTTLEALVAAFMQMSGMGGSKDRTQSTELVVSSFLQALGAAR